LAAVLRRTPWIFNDWFVALQRWQDFLRPDFLTFIDLWVQVRGIPLPYLSELTMSFIAGTLGPVLELDFNQDTSTYVAFIRVKIRLVFTDRLRFFRRVRFESREGAMIGFEYEKLRRICTNCYRITHQVNNCPFLNAHVIHDDEAEVLDVPVWEEGAASKTITDQTHRNSSDSSDISSTSPISQPPLPASLPSHDSDFIAGFQASRLVNPSTIPQNHFSSSSSDFKGKGKAKFETGEC